MKTLFFLFLFLPALFFAQKKKLKPVYGFYLNKGVEKINPGDKNLDVRKSKVIGYYVSIGLNFYKDSTFIFYTGLRYGRENSRFFIQPRNTELQYRTTNLPLDFIFAPGARINKHQTLFLTLNIVRVIQANNGGGGGGSRRGKNYSYEYVNNLPQNSWDFRAGIKWQIKPDPAKKFAFDIGVEPSLINRKIIMTVKDPNTNLSGTSYRMNYDLIMFYMGFQF